MSQLNPRDEQQPGGSRQPRRVYGQRQSRRSGVNSGDSAQPPRILLVEDNPADADLCRMYLEEGFGPGVEVVHVTHLHQAETVLRRRPMDVVLLDLGLPDAAGVESVRCLHTSYPEVPIVVLTGNRDAQLGVQVIRENAQDYCAKQDLNAGVLLQSIRHAMERNRLQAQYLRLLETSPDGMLVVDVDGRLLFVNQAACGMLDLDAGSAVGRILLPELADTDADELQLPNGRVVEIRSVEVDWNATAATLLAYHDVTARKQAESDLQQLVQYDQLTGLASRGYFFDYVERLISQVDREGGMIPMLFMDLDRFKLINDTLGHSAGDELLRKVGERLRQHCRAGDFLARIGGDEFALIPQGVHGPNDAAHIAENLIRTFKEPIELTGASVAVGLSIGIATYPDCGEGVRALYAAADTAMYRAKEQGQNRYQFFSTLLQRKAELRIRREQAVRQVAADKAFWLAYQPQISAMGGTPVALEALLRWPLDTDSSMSPAEFVPVLEDLGLIEGIGLWVIQNAAQTILDMERETGLSLRIAVNVSMSQLFDHRLYGEIVEVLKVTGLEPHRLELELTESSIMSDPVRAQNTLGAVRRLGVTVAIDDFGTGYSSLSYLRRLPVDVLKIDKSFISDIGRNRETEAILHSLLGLAPALGLKVVAEGVETEEQRSFLLAAGCDYLQGYQICRPGPAGEISEWLKGNG